MKILHTSDWHLGRKLYGRSRHDEFAAFLDWLAGVVEARGIDTLLVAGDVFDTGTPGTHTQELYYRFLSQVAAGPCRHLVVTGGNHDSPSFLEAPRRVLAALGVEVVGRAAEDPADEVLLLRDARGAPELIVAAVPYLRDRDIRQVDPGERVEDKERKLVEGIGDHYAAVGEAAERMRATVGGEIPVVGMGHLFTAGARTIEGDGVRDLYVGSLAAVRPVVFPRSFDYLALGHLHVPQRVAGSETLRYCGSPIPMRFGAAGQAKQVLEVTFDAGQASVAPIEVPRFQRLEQVRGDWDGIAARLGRLVEEGADAWLEVVYEGEALIGDLRQRLEAAVGDAPLEILRVRNRRIGDRVLERMDDQEALDDLDVEQVFRRCLEVHEVPEGQRMELEQAYHEALASLEDPEEG